MAIRERFHDGHFPVNVAYSGAVAGTELQNMCVLLIVTVVKILGIIVEIAMVFV